MELVLQVEVINSGLLESWSVTRKTLERGLGRCGGGSTMVTSVLRGAYYRGQFLLLLFSSSLLTFGITGRR